MVLDQDTGTRNAGRLPEELRDVFGVVQDVHEQAGVEGPIGEWKPGTIESATRDSAGGAGNEFNAFDRDVPPLRGKLEGDRAVAAANVQNAC